MFDLCLNALAVHGHLVVIGMISQVRSSAYDIFLNCTMCC
jgi:NADPH-dependent curcumin reductase CurA